ncbi:alpha/beta fold hydrolase, partial [Endomicrobium sp. AH-315-J14]|nr:alpha/beta fold hydrolase [Endomicrobium sp. AH-315-J14]
MLLRLAKVLTGAIEARTKVGKTPADVVHAENKWRLLRYRGRTQGRAFATPILMVPSLINRHYVLDLLPGKSLVEYLVGRGHDVFIIDWGTPTAEDRFLSFDDICDRYIGRAVRKATKIAGSDGVHLLGYCLGGTFTTIYTAARPKLVKSMVVLAAPVDFDDDGMLARWTNTPSFDVAALVEANGLVPWQLMQASFQMLRPTLNLTKVVGVLDRLWDDPFLDGFFALEAWGSDNVSFPGRCYQRYIESLYRDNALIEGRFTLSGDPVKLDAIRCPLLTVTFEHDTIVSKQSAAVLVDHVSSDDKQLLELSGGHVGAVVSRKAAKGLW